MKDSPIEIVIIEDEEDILELLEYHLSKQGYEVTGFYLQIMLNSFWRKRMYHF